MNDPGDALRVLSEVSLKVEDSLRRWRRQVERGGQGGAELRMLDVQVGLLATAVESLPDELAGSSPDVPWRELRRLPMLLARYDVKFDPAILAVTLLPLMPRVRDAVRRLLDGPEADESRLRGVTESGQSCERKPLVHGSTCQILDKFPIRYNCWSLSFAISLIPYRE